MEELMHEKKGEALANVLALLIYDLVLFPTNGNLVSPAATDVFMAFKCRGESSAFPLLADMHHTLSYCHEQEGKRIECCLPVLYVWLAAHVIKRKVGSFCPISKLTNMQSQTYTNKEWRQMFMELNEDSVCWYPLATGVVRVLFACGEFSNVPLMGTLGCINYNPILALRQLRYPLIGPPTKESLSPFKTGLKDEVMLDKIRKAWKNVIYKAGELGKRSHGASITYKEWVRSRVEEIKLPFQTLVPNPPQEIDTVSEDGDEVKTLKDKLARSEAEKEALETELKNARLVLKGLEIECNEKAQSIERASKRARVEKDSGSKTMNYLSLTNQDLRKQIAKCHEENEQLKRGLKERERQVKTLKSQMNEQASQHETDRRINEQASLEIIKEYRERLKEEQLKIEGLLKNREDVLEDYWKLKGEKMHLEETQVEARQQLINLDRKMHETIEQYVAQYEEKIRRLRLEANEAIHGCRATIERKDEELRSLEHWAEERDHFMRLIRAAEVNRIEAWYEVGHWASKLKDIRRIPELVRDAEAMVNPLTTPREAIELIDVCKRLVGDFEELVEQAKEDVVVEIIDI